VRLQSSQSMFEYFIAAREQPSPILGRLPVNTGRLKFLP
jgi:hypothetical protein